MKFLKSNLKAIIAFIIGVILSGGIVYAAVSAGEVSYTREGTNIKTVADALNNLYNESTKNLSVEIINNSYTNDYITATTTKNYDYIIITGCKWYWSKGYICSNFTVTGEYENYINKFGVSGNDFNDQDASDIAILKNVKKNTVITLGESNNSVYKNLNIVGVCIE